MKTGIGFSYPSGFFTLWGDDTYKKLKSFGFSCVDFGLLNTETFFYTDKEKAEKTILMQKKLAAEAGIEFSQVHGPWRWPAQDVTPEDRAERMEKMRESIRLTALLGCKNWVIHPIFANGWEDVKEGKTEETWKINLEFFRELLKTAKEYDVTICLENMPMINFSIATPADILRFVKEIDDDHFKICLDTGHLNVFPELPVYESVAELGDELRVLHVHDNKFRIDMHLPPFYGSFKWTEFCQALKEIEFDGVISLETAPSSGHNNELFEEMMVMFHKMAQQIADEIEG